jgi:hypothetical protein
MNPLVNVAPNALERIRAEFIEMPGLRLTVAQAQGLWAIDLPTCERLIDTLLASGFLVWTCDGAVIVRGEK